MSYIGAQLTEASRTALVEWWQASLGHDAPLLRQQYAHHCTLKFNPSAHDRQLLPSRSLLTLQVIGYGADSRGQAVVVRCRRLQSANAVPHITVATNGTPPAYSNQLLAAGWRPVFNGPILLAQLGPLDPQLAHVATPGPRQLVKVRLGEQLESLDQQLRQQSLHQQVADVREQPLDQQERDKTQPLDQQRGHTEQPQAQWEHPVLQLVRRFDALLPLPPLPPGMKQPTDVRIKVAKVLREYKAQTSDELSLSEGDFVQIVSQVDNGRHKVENLDRQQGLVPSSFLSPLSDEQESEPSLTHLPETKDATDDGDFEDSYFRSVALPAPHNVAPALGVTISGQGWSLTSCPSLEELQQVILRLSFADTKVRVHIAADDSQLEFMGHALILGSKAPGLMVQPRADNDNSPAHMAYSVATQCPTRRAFVQAMTRVYNMQIVQEEFSSLEELLAVISVCKSWQLEVDAYYGLELSIPTVTRTWADVATLLNSGVRPAPEGRELAVKSTSDRGPIPYGSTLFMDEMRKSVVEPVIHKMRVDTREKNIDQLRSQLKAIDMKFMSQALNCTQSIPASNADLDWLQAMAKSMGKVLRALYLEQALKQREEKPPRRVGKTNCLHGLENPWIADLLRDLNSEDATAQSSARQILLQDDAVCLQALIHCCSATELGDLAQSILAQQQVLAAYIPALFDIVAHRFSAEHSKKGYYY